jgi:hypothetical protein
LKTKDLKMNLFGRVLGIVGSEGKKFTTDTAFTARELIRDLLKQEGVRGVSSGHCHLGGIDIWAEEVADELGLEKFIFPPKNQTWATGYKPRNLQIVAASTEVHCITLQTLPENYLGMRFKMCYLCGTSDHVKSGGCWTMHQAIKSGKPGILHVI